jgi:hypothetical protein
VSLTVAFAVSGHGFGHSVRCAEVARALLARDVHLVVHTTAPRWLYPPEADYEPVQLDVGVVQHGGLELDIDATRDAWHRFMLDAERRVADEANALRDADFVLCDTPALAFEAAASVGVASAALTNFGWDWIYSSWRGFEPIVERIRDGYRRADRLFRLPLHSCESDAFAAFSTIEDVPLVARRATQSREAVRVAHDLPCDARLVLLSFGGFDAQGLDVEALGQWREYVFVAAPPIRASETLPPNVRVLPDQPDDYPSLLAACDAVITKPGYGIVADCLANRVSVLFTDRGPFREYPVLADALPRLGNARYIPSDRLLRGQVGDYLDQLLREPRPWSDMCINGADVVADRVLELCRSRSGLN